MRESLSSYMAAINEAKSTLVSQAERLCPYITRRQKPYSTRDSFRPESSRRDTPRHDSHYRDIDRQERPSYRRDKPPRERNRSRERNHRSRERRPEEDRRRDKPIIANGRSDYHLRKDRNERAHLVRDALSGNEKSDDETASQSSVSDADSQAAHFVGERVVSVQDHIK